MSTKIEWATETWNYITGCDPISPGCDHCYAQKMANRLAGRYGYHKRLPFRVTVHPDKLWKPMHIKKRSMIFCNSMGDIFHKDVSFDAFNEMIKVISAVKTQHIYLFLTKRANNMALFLIRYMQDHPDQPLPSNIMWGITVENKEHADKRIGSLAEIKRNICKDIKTFISFEPLLENLTIAFNGRPSYFKPDWIIVGGETGPGARRMPREAVDDIYKFCNDNTIPFFFKKWGSAYKGILPDDRMRVYRSKIREEIPLWLFGN